MTDGVSADVDSVSADGGTISADAAPLRFETGERSARQDQRHMSGPGRKRYRGLASESVRKFAIASHSSARVPRSQGFR